MYIIEKQTKMFFHPGSAGKRKGKPKLEFIFHLPAKIGVVPKTGPAKKKKGDGSSVSICWKIENCIIEGFLVVGVTKAKK